MISMASYRSLCTPARSMHHVYSRRVSSIQRTFGRFYCTKTSSTFSSRDSTSTSDEVVTFNVGGKTFETFKSTFMAHPETLLARMISSSTGIAKKRPNGEYFIDRNPDFFKIILEYYRNKTIVVPKQTSLENLRNELKFYGIDYKEDDIKIAEELGHTPVECYLSLTDAYNNAIYREGHLLGGVVIGFNYEDEDEFSKEDKVSELFNDVSQNIASSRRYDYYEETISNKSKQNDNANKESEPKNGEYVYGTMDSLEELQQSLSEVAHSFFCCGGTEIVTRNETRLLMASPITDTNNTTKNDNTNPNQNTNKDPILPTQQQFEDCGYFNNLNIDLIKSMCTPAPFGDLKTMQTKLDPNVRQALECAADRFMLSNFYEYKVLKYIDKILNYNRGTKLVLYKLNIYEPGGFFKEHVDTPINPSKMIGSLVLCLPTEHEGGELKVTHNGISHTYDFAKESKNDNMVQWAAFYSDCVHEVKPVTKGTRITITYAIESTNSPLGYRAGIPEYAFCGPADATMNNAKIDHLVQNLCDLPPFIQKIGLFLNHKYTSSAIDMETLKGSDRLLVEKVGAKWNYFLTPVVYNEITKTEVGEREERDYEKITGDVFAFSMDDLKYLNGKGPKPNHKFSAVPFIVSKQKGSLLYRQCDEGAEYTGNCARPAEDDSIYYHAVVILTRK